MKSGIVTASWNQWVNNQEGQGQAVLGGIPVGNLHDYVDQFSYYSCQGDIEEHLQKRLKFLESLRIFRNKPERQDKLMQTWKQAVSTSLGELYAFKQAVSCISRSYFDDHQILFPDYQRALTELITCYEENVKSFNDSIANGIKSCEPLNLEEMRHISSQLVNQHLSSLVDHAKCEALDCLGEEEEATKIAERYI